ncbi:MAG: DnaD domain protein [Chloroflexota bacterium]
MKPFAGFPPRARYTGIPALFFSALLPEIDDLAELKVTLHVLWLLAHKPGSARSVAEDELLADRALMAGLACCGSDATAALRRGLERAVARGTLLRADVKKQGQAIAEYSVNNEGGRQAAAEAHHGAMDSNLSPREPAPTQPTPNMYQLYEQEKFGLLTPMVAEKLKDFESEYSEEWIAEAMRLSVEHNHRRLSYVEGILKRWRDEGKEHGEPGRHPEKDGYTSAWEQYRARRGR